MKRFWAFFLLAFIFLFNAPLVLASDLPEIDFFYSTTCPHCREENKFLDKLEKEYSDLVINRYLFSLPDNQKILLARLEEIGQEEAFGSVPITFVGDKFILGFDSEKGVGELIRSQLPTENQEVEVEKSENEVYIPFLGLINPGNYSLPALAVILGFLDGFNVCSLGALALIIGLVIALQDRKKIMVYGGVFIFTTAFIYGLLIFFWHQLFVYVARYTSYLELLIAGISIVAAYYLWREYQECKKQGVACKFGNVPIVKKLSNYVQKSFEKKASMLSVALAIFAFAGVITIVEFPCSAGLPVIFAGILADANLGTLAYLSLMTIFVIFYMLDELIVYGIAVYKMSLWLGNPKFMTKVILLEAILLFSIGIYYLGSVLGII